MPYYGSENYDYERPHSRRSRHSQHYLVPDGRYGSGLHRTRSQGHSPAPQINIYNDQMQDSHSRTSSPYPYAYPIPQASPPQAPQVPQTQVLPIPYAVPEYRHHHRSPSSEGSSRGRRHGRLEDEVVRELAEIALRDGLRSRSRGRTDAAVTDRSGYELWRLEEKEKAAEQQRQRKLWEEEADWKRMKEEREHKEEQERLIADYEDKKRKDEEKRKAEEERIKDKIEKDKRDAEEKEKKAYEEFLLKQEKKKRDAEKEYEEFLLKQKQKEEEKKAKEKEEKEKVEQEMKRRMINAGYTDSQIQFVLDEERQKKLKERADLRDTIRSETVLYNKSPTYVKVHKSYLSVETLRYYDIPFEWCRDDPNYIIVLREMDKYETEVLFEHTRRLKTGKLLIETPREKDKQYAWFRKRDRSTSRVRKYGILEYK